MKNEILSPLPHKQVCVKVNAYVDETIAPVVEALSRFSSLITECSCEDNRSNSEIREGHLPRSYIMFHAREKYENWEELSKLCNEIAKAISDYRYAEISIRWKGGKPVGMLEFNTDDAYWLTLAINSYNNRD